MIKISACGPTLMATCLLLGATHAGADNTLTTALIAGIVSGAGETKLTMNGRSVLNRAGSIQPLAKRSNAPCSRTSAFASTGHSGSQTPHATQSSVILVAIRLPSFRVIFVYSIQYRTV